MHFHKLSLNRRNFLRGAGLAMALPWLETFAANGPKGGGSSPTIKRFFSVYHPDGVGLPLKADPAFQDWSWFPHKKGSDYTFSKVLDVLNPLRGDITVYSGLSHPAARTVHGHSNADQYLTGASIGGSGEYKNTISVDQAYAEYIGEYTRHSSLVMSTNGGTGAPRGTHTSSFNRLGRPIPALDKPKHIFDMLFVTQGKDAAEKLARSKSALDVLISNTKSLERQLSKHDQRTLAQYLDSVRDTEVKLDKAQKWLTTPLPKVDAKHVNLDVDPKNARVYLQTIYELTYLAFLSDSTRAATYNMGRENGGGIHDILAKAVNLPNAHGLTHDVKKPKGWENLGTYNRFQLEEFGRFIQRLKDTKEPNGQGSMLDNTFAMHGSASSSFHLSRNYPIISAGGKNMGFKNGRYLKYDKGNDDNQSGAGITTDAGWRSKVDVVDQPLGHLFVTILQRLGVETEEFAGCKGGLEGV